MQCILKWLNSIQRWSTQLGQCHSIFFFCKDISRNINADAIEPFPAVLTLSHFFIFTHFLDLENRAGRLQLQNTSIFTEEPILRSFGPFPMWLTCGNKVISPNCKQFLKWLRICLVLYVKLHGFCLSIVDIANATANTPQSYPFNCRWFLMKLISNLVSWVNKRLAQQASTKELVFIVCKLSKIVTTGYFPTGPSSKTKPWAATIKWLVPSWMICSHLDPLAAGKLPQPPFCQR